MKTYEEASQDLLEAMVADQNCSPQTESVISQMREIADDKLSTIVLVQHSYWLLHRLNQEPDSVMERCCTVMNAMVSLGVVIGQRMEKQESNWLVGQDLPHDEAYLPTYSGRKFHFLDPKPEEICLLDIAHSLSGTPRYLRHTKHTISVAEHTVRMAAFLECTFSGYGYAHEESHDSIRYCLLHDAPEAYLGEWPKPLKVSIIGDSIRWHEDRIMKVILEKYKCRPSPSDRQAVELVDRGIVYAETELSGNMDYSLLPIKLEESDKRLGQEIYDTLCARRGWRSYGWEDEVAKSRFLDLCEAYDIRD